MGYLAAVTVPRYRNDRFNCGDVFGHHWMGNRFVRTNLVRDRKRRRNERREAHQSNRGRYPDPVCPGSHVRLYDEIARRFRLSRRFRLDASASGG